MARQLIRFAEVPRYLWQLSGQQVPLSGTATVASGSTLVTGVGTFFRSQLAPGDQLTLDAETRVVASISTETALTVTEAFAAAHSGAVPRRSFTYSFAMLGQEIEWRRGLGNADARVAQDLCSGQPLLVLRSDGAAPVRRGVLHLHCHPDGTEDQQLQGFLACYVSGGPYLLTMPTGRTVQVLFDRSQEWLEQRLANGGYRIQVSVLEVP